MRICCLGTLCGTCHVFVVCLVYIFCLCCIWCSIQEFLLSTFCDDSQILPSRYALSLLTHFVIRSLSWAMYRAFVVVTLCYSCAIDLDVCVWNVFVQGKLMKYVSHTIFTISSIVVIATILIVYFTSNNYMTVVLSIVVIYIDFS